MFTFASSLERDLFANCPPVDALLIQWSSSIGKPGFYICYDTLYMTAAFTQVNTTKPSSCLYFMFTKHNNLCLLRLLAKVDCSDVCASKSSNVGSYCDLSCAYLDTQGPKRLLGGFRDAMHTPYCYLTENWQKPRNVRPGFRPSEIWNRGCRRRYNEIPLCPLTCSGDVLVLYIRYLLYVRRT